MLETIKTTCTLDCQDACGVEAEVENGRIVRLRGSKTHPYTEGFLCIRLNRYLDRLYNSGRVTSPLQKTKGGWRKISWDDAIDLAASKFRVAVDAYGSAAILYYMSSGSFGISNRYNIRLFNRLGGPTVASGSLCLSAGVAGMVQSLGLSMCPAPSEMVNSRMIVLWGRNPAAYSIHMIPLIKKARENGAKIILIDPIRNESAKFCDRHYAPKPGGDGYLALAICKFLLEEDKADREFLENATANAEAIERMCQRFSWDELSVGCGLSVETLWEIAILFGLNHPATICMGRGPQHYRQGAEITRLILAACAVSGNIGVQGGGYNYNSDFWGPFDRSLDGGEFATSHRTAPKAIIGEAILNMKDPPIRAAYIHGGNPVTQCPNSQKVARALRSIDFVTVVDSFLTDTAECADLFLPSAMFLETRDIRAAGWNPYVGPVVPAVQPPEGVKTDWEIVGLLAQRLGIEDPYLGQPIEKFLPKSLAPIEKHGLNPARAINEVFRNPECPRIPFEGGVFATPSSKFEFLEEWEPEGGPEVDERFPLRLLSLKYQRYQSSQVLESQQKGSEATAWIHPETATQFGLGEGARGRLLSPSGECEVLFALDKGLRKDVCLVRSGGWMKKGHGVNVLTEDILTNSGECSGYYETRVRPVAQS